MFLVLLQGRFLNWPWRAAPLRGKGRNMALQRGREQMQTLVARGFHVHAAEAGAFLEARP
jgi:hypothetical protein